MMKNIIGLVNVILAFVLVLGLGSCRRVCYGDSIETNTHSEKDSFVTIWKVGDEDPFDKQIIIPVNPDFEYKYNIRWSKLGASNFKEELDNTGRKVINFPSAGKYRVEISGNFPAIYFHEENDISRKKLLSVEQWGKIKRKSMKSAFALCSNLVINAKDSPDLSRVTDMTSMFYGAKSFNQNIEDWDVSNVTVMDFMFYGAESFNQPLNRWNVVSVSHMSHIFERALSFDQDLNSWSLRMKKDVGRAYMFRDAKSFSKRTRISTWGLNDSTCKDLFGSKC